MAPTGPTRGSPAQQRVVKLLTALVALTATLVVALGVGAALVMYVLHGMTDYLLWQTGMLFMFFTLIGLVSWLEDQRVQAQDEFSAEDPPGDGDAAEGRMRQGMKYISL